MTAITHPDATNWLMLSSLANVTQQMVMPVVARTTRCTSTGLGVADIADASQRATVKRGLQIQSNTAHKIRL
jgi:hypothetical protein